MMEHSERIYKRSAENGLVLGPLMGAVMLLWGASCYHGWLLLPTVAGMVAVPATVWKMLRRSRCRGGEAGFAPLWLEGIATFFFGSLLMAVMVYASLRWLWPGFVTDQLNILTEALSQVNTPDSARMQQLIAAARRSGTVPGPGDITVNLIYMAVLSGSVLSAVFSLILLAVRPGAKTPPPHNP